ncbi:hypothetical protein HGRIS_004873 [Hohenbuehelia grisea]|uniref:Uncharacterized protein n=1 Tax=Hohenbuehelia grisea TaxID=104357 RepID=A0ABR3JD82_9AGAR
MPSPSWPSLYNPGIEILHIDHRDPIQPDGSYLTDANDVFRFTLYWNLVLHTPVFLACGLYAFFNLSFPPTRRTAHEHSAESAIPMSPLSPDDRVRLLKPTKPAKQNERRSRLAFALLVLFSFTALGVAGAVIGSAVMGYVLAALFKAGKFHMSTWVPFLLVLIQLFVGLLSVPSRKIFDII